MKYQFVVSTSILPFCLTFCLIDTAPTNTTSVFATSVTANSPDSDAIRNDVNLTGPAPFPSSNGTQDLDPLPNDTYYGGFYDSPPMYGDYYFGPPAVLNPQANQTANHTVNTTNKTLNGLPTFCAFSAVSACRNVSLRECSFCSLTGAGLFAFAVAILALAIILTNALVIWVFVKCSDEFGNYAKIKLSLAAADLLTGLFLVLVTLPNFSKTLDMTGQQLFDYVIQQRRSPQATAGGIFYLLLFTSSLYHLIFLAQQRLHAIRWPLTYKHVKERNIQIGIAIVWSLALLAAISPLWFPHQLVFGYFHITFLYDVSADEAGSGVAPMIPFLVIVFLVPFLLMTSIAVVTAIFTRDYLKKSAQIHTTQQLGKPEAKVFVTLAAMQIGFTVTLLPLFVTTILSYVGILEFASLAVPYATSFYLAMSNSLVNVLVYSVVDEKFRHSVVKLLPCLGSMTKMRSSSAGSTPSTKTRVSHHSSSRKLSQSTSKKGDTIA